MIPELEGTTDNLLRLQQERAAKRYLNVLRQRINKISSFLWANNQPVFEDSYPGKSVPFCFSLMYFIPEVVLSTTLDATKALLPRGDNLKVSHEGSFYLCEVNAFQISNSKVSTPADNINIFKSVEDGGGFNYITSVNAYIDLYDRKRGRSLSNVPMADTWFSARGFENRKLATELRLDPDTELEARLYVNNAVNAGYYNIVFKGYKVLGGSQ